METKCGANPPLVHLERSREISYCFLFLASLAAMRDVSTALDMTEYLAREANCFALRLVIFNFLDSVPLIKTSHDDI